MPVARGAEPFAWASCQSLFELSVRRATGKLTVRHGELERHAYFVEGVPEMTTSNDEKELLGAFLVARGFALPMEIEMALAVAPRYGGRLGDALVGLGVLRPIELVRAVVDQMRSRFIGLVGSKEGYYRFIEGERVVNDESMREAIDPLELITRGVFASSSLPSWKSCSPQSWATFWCPYARAGGGAFAPFAHRSGDGARRDDRPGGAGARTRDRRGQRRMRSRNGARRGVRWPIVRSVRRDGMANACAPRRASPASTLKRMRPRCAAKGRF